VLRAKDTFEQQQLLHPLVQRCSVAAFGLGRKTRYDRHALQIKAEGGAFPSFTSIPPRRAYWNRSAAR